MKFFKFINIKTKIFYIFNFLRNLRIIKFLNNRSKGNIFININNIYLKMEIHIYKRHKST